MTTANKARSILGILTGLVYVALALTGADGIVWVVPAVVAGAAYSVMGVMNRPEGRERNRNRSQNR